MRIASSIAGLLLIGCSSLPPLEIEIDGGAPPMDAQTSTDAPCDATSALEDATVCAALDAPALGAVRIAGESFIRLRSGETFARELTASSPTLCEIVSAELPANVSLEAALIRAPASVRLSIDEHAVAGGPFPCALRLQCGVHMLTDTFDLLIAGPLGASDDSLGELGISQRLIEGVRDDGIVTAGFRASGALELVMSRDYAGAQTVAARVMPNGEITAPHSLSTNVNVAVIEAHGVFDAYRDRTVVIATLQNTAQVSRTVFAMLDDEALIIDDRAEALELPSSGEMAWHIASTSASRVVLALGTQRFAYVMAPIATDVGWARDGHADTLYACRETTMSDGYVSACIEGDGVLAVTRADDRATPLSTFGADGSVSFHLGMDGSHLEVMHMLAREDAVFVFVRDARYAPERALLIKVSDDGALVPLGPRGQTVLELSPWAQYSRVLDAVPCGDGIAMIVERDEVLHTRDVRILDAYGFADERFGADGILLSNDYASVLRVEPRMERLMVLSAKNDVIRARRYWL